MKSLEAVLKHFEDLYEEEAARVFAVDRSRMRVRATLLSDRATVRVDVYLDGVHIADDSEQGQILHRHMKERYSSPPPAL